MSRGSVLAEFAFTSMIMLTVMFGIIDVGRALYTYHGVSNAARLASRYAIVNGASSCPGGTPSPDPLQAYVAGQLPGIDPSQLHVTTTCADAASCEPHVAPFNITGCAVSVTVSYQFRFLTPFVSALVHPMTSTSTMIISM
jgi:Flp pilus assembly protein TadG